MSPLSGKWLPLTDSQRNPEGRWESFAKFKPSSPWFSGHFGEYLLLPAAALLALAAEAVAVQGRKQGRLLWISKFSGVRFKRFVFPDEELLVSVGAVPSGTEALLDFQITSRGRTVARGEMTVKETASRG
jgi:hypothetical protein